MECDGQAHVVWGDGERFDSDIPDQLVRKCFGDRVAM